GGNTPCLEVALGGKVHLVFDAGTGIRLLGKDLASRPGGLPAEFHVFLTHFHLDHVQGLPFFAPIHRAGNRIVFHGPALRGFTVGGVLGRAVPPPFFPLRLADSPAEITFEETSDHPAEIHGIPVRPVPLNHPGGSTGWLVGTKERSLLYATDTEHG